MKKKMKKKLTRVAAALTLSVSFALPVVIRSLCAASYTISGVREGVNINIRGKNINIRG